MLTLTLLTLVKLQTANSDFLELVKTKRSNSNLKVQLFTVSEKGARRSKQHDVPQEEAADDATVAPSAPDEDVGGEASPPTLSSSTSSLRPRIES
jgi:hypothetical protein